MDLIGLFIYGLGVLFAFIAAYYARLAYLERKEATELVFDIGFPEGDKVITRRVVNIEPDRMGQRVHFRVINRSKYPVKLPWGVVRFPTIFKHPDENDPDKLTTNTTLGKVQLGNINGRPVYRVSEDQPDGTTKIQGILSIDLFSPKEPEDFWIRYKLPDRPSEWSIEVRIDAAGKRSLTKKLTLVGKHP